MYTPYLVFRTSRLLLLPFLHIEGRLHHYRFRGTYTLFGKVSSHTDIDNTRVLHRYKKIPSPLERGDWHKYVVLAYSAAFSSATASASTAGASATSAAGATSAAFLERRVRLAFFSVFAMLSL